MTYIYRHHPKTGWSHVARLPCFLGCARVLRLSIIAIASMCADYLLASWFLSGTSETIAQTCLEKGLNRFVMSQA